MNDTKTKILDVAEDLIQRVGLNAMSYKDIAEAVGIRKASIHHHFPKKEDLVNGLLLRCMDSHKELYHDIVHGKQTPMQKLEAVANIFAEGLLLKKICLIGSINNSCTTLQEASAKQLEINIESTVSLFTLIFEEGRANGSLLFIGSPADAAHAYLSFLLGCQSLCRSHGGIEKFNNSVGLFLNSLKNNDTLR